MGDLEEGERETARKIGRVTCHGALNGKGITACSYGHFVAGLGIVLLAVILDRVSKAALSRVDKQRNAH